MTKCSTPVKFPGITIIRSRKKLCIRLRRDGKFDRSFVIENLLWDNPEDHEKVKELINDAIVETEWIPYDENAMKRLYKNLYEKHGKFKDIHNKYQHLSSLNPCESFDRLFTENNEDTKCTKDKLVDSEKDTVLTELRLIRNYLERLTLLQEDSKK